MSTLDTLHETILTRLDPAHWLAVAHGTVKDAPAKGTARAWFEAHHGDRVTTVQVSPTMGLWAPSGRMVDATRAGSVVLGDPGSTRYYKGLRVLHTTTDALICQDDNGTVILYVIEPK